MIKNSNGSNDSSFVSFMHRKPFRKTGDRNASEETLGDRDSVGGDLYWQEPTLPKRAAKDIFIPFQPVDTGNSDSISMVEVDNPSYLTLSLDERFIYTVSENNESGSAVHVARYNEREDGTAELPPCEQ